MSSTERIDENLTPVYDSTGAINQVGEPSPWTNGDERDGAIARHYDMIDPRTVMGIDRLARRTAQTLGVIAMAGAVVVSSYFSKDVIPERQRLEDTHSSITFTQDALHPEDNGRGVLPFTGWGTMNSKNIVTALPYEEIGQEAYFSYDPAGISHKKNAEAAKQFAAERGLDRLVIHGSSMGGNMGLHTAALLHEDDDAPSVEALILDCSPLTADAVRPERRLAGDRMLQLTSAIPGAENSRAILATAMMMDRNDQYMDGFHIDWHAAFNTGARVRERIVGGRDAPIKLRNEQFRVIMSEGTEDSLRILSKERKGKTVPRVFLLVPHDPDSDSTVDNERSAEFLLSLDEKFDVRVTIVTLPPGTGHANPAQRSEQYSAALRNDIFPVIERERAARQVYVYAGQSGVDKNGVRTESVPADILAEARTEQQTNDANSPTG